jgi:hypothetical protein
MFTILARTPGHLSDLVTVAAPADATDHELANHAGLCSRHFGYNVTRHDDGTATVCLWND